MTPDYIEGRLAWDKGQAAAACPHGWEAADYQTPTEEREVSPICRRHWWLAGWHDRDMEKGMRVTWEAA
ncbi:hypothetical protein [Halomonas sp. IOP_31]|uniref:hypothetical protein n=1 Tax=Halomonas sp. IOP_31 TaxID=2876584 RepID=UPI001E4DE198|nr:hypothetical protein [Halomonas sp. IOP_31]MCD6006882.1 hypothetical protein [Halomonas sp. IOP_31]